MPDLIRQNRKLDNIRPPDQRDGDGRVEFIYDAHSFYAHGLQKTRGTGRYVDVKGHENNTRLSREVQVGLCDDHNEEMQALVNIGGEKSMASRLRAGTRLLGGTPEDRKSGAFDPSSEAVTAVKLPARYTEDKSRDGKKRTAAFTRLLAISTEIKLDVKLGEEQLCLDVVEGADREPCGLAQVRARS